MGRCRLGVAVFVALAAAIVTGDVAVAQTGVEDAATELLAFVPEDHRYGCEIADPASPDDVGNTLSARQATIAAMVECGGGVDDVEYVAYVRFTTLDSMNAAFREFAGNAGEQAPRSSDGECPGENTWNFSGDSVGSVACYYSSTDGLGNAIPERAALAWTYDDELILGIASTAAADADALSSWWDDEAGPTRTADDVEGLVAAPGERDVAEEKYLRKHVPAEFRKSCEPFDVGDLQSISETYYRTRLFVSAGLSCLPPEGADQVRYYSVHPDVIDSYFEPFEKIAPDEVDDCPGTGTWSLGKGHRAREIGEYSCYATDDYPALVVWSHGDLGILAVATRDDGDFDKLFEFWDTDAGPV